MSKHRSAYSLYADPAILAARNAQSAAYKDGFKKGRAEGYREALERAAVLADNDACARGVNNALAAAIRALAKEA